MKTRSIFILLFASLSLAAQNIQSPVIGARGAGMGGTGVVFSDINSAFSNQAGLANLDKISALAIAERQFLKSPINNVSVAVAYPSGFGTFALTLNNYGIEGYKEQKIGLAYARKLFDQLSIAAQFDYLNTSIPIYGSRGVFTFEVGLQAKLLDELSFGFHLYSPAQVELLEETTLPTIYTAGLAYTPSKKAYLTLEIEKDIDYPVRFKAGLEYRFVENFFFRTGIATQPTLVSMGVGLLLENGLLLDIATSYHQVLGISPSVGIGYEF